MPRSCRWYSMKAASTPYVLSRAVHLSPDQLASKAPLTCEIGKTSDPKAPALAASSEYGHFRPEETAMNPSSAVSYDLAQARIADLRHQARGGLQARAAVRAVQPDRVRVPGRLRLRLAYRRRATATAS